MRHKQRDAMPDTDKKKKKLTHIKLTSHPEGGSTQAYPIKWGATDALSRGPLIGSQSHPEQRNVIGAHSGSYAVYRALAIAAGDLSPVHVPDLTDTAPAMPTNTLESAKAAVFSRAVPMPMRIAASSFCSMQRRPKPRRLRSSITVAASAATAITNMAK